MLQAAIGDNRAMRAGTVMPAVVAFTAGRSAPLGAGESSPHARRILLDLAPTGSSGSAASPGGWAPPPSCTVSTWLGEQLERHHRMIVIDVAGGE
jgi:hypothetical protein